MRIKVSIDKPLPTDGGELQHVSTSWQISRVPDFNIREAYIAESLEDDINLLEFRPSIELEDNVSVYARVKYHFNNGSASNWSKIIPINTNQRGIKMSGTVIATPKVSVEFKYNGINFSNLKITSSRFILYSGAGNHVSTDWYIKDINGKVLWERKGDKKYLNEIIVDSSYVEPNKVYFIEAVYNTDVNVSSLTGKAILNTNIDKNNLFKLEILGDLVPNRDTYFKLWVYTRLHETTDILIKDNNGITVSSGLDLVGNELKVNSGGLIPYHKYTIMARLKLNNGGVTAYSKVGDFICKENNIITINPFHKYLEKYNFTQEVQTKGPVVFSSTQLYNDSILTVKHNDNNIYLQKLCNGRLKDQGSILTINDFKSIMDKSYVNIVPLLDGKVLIDYNAIRKVDIYSDYVSETIRNNMLSNNIDRYEYNGLIIVNNHDENENIDVLVHRPRFELYEFNPLTNELLLLKSLTRDDEKYGTSITNSIVQTDTSTIWYAPAFAVSDVDSETPVNIKLKKLDLNSLTITETRNPPVVTKAYPTLFKMDGNVYFTAGSNEPVVVNHVDSWKRSNNDIYKMTTSTWTKVGNLVTSIPDDMYALAAYTRKDGKIILFNNVTDGASVGDQRTITLNKDFSSYISENDMGDGMLYRNAIQLQNGDFIRISTRTEDPQLVYTYISDTMSGDHLTENDTVDIILDLVVPVGTKLQVEDLYRYESVVVEGDSDDNTGELRWLDDGEEIIFHYDDLIVTRDMTIEQDLYLGNIREYNSITILEDASLEVYNVINVPEGETFTIEGPITVEYITVGEGGELIIT